MDNRTISICIPSYNRFQMTLESFVQVANDDRISEVIISDDYSTDDSWQQLTALGTTNGKVKLFRNDSNQDCYWNKRIAIEHATNDWCILLDSDNIIDKSYLDAIFAIPEWSADTIYQPQWARPHFDFRPYSGLTITKSNVAEYIDKPMFETMLNAANYFVNRDEYLLCFDSSKDPVTSDSIFTAYNWLRSGNQIYVVLELEYEHRIHSGSHYQNNVNRTPPNFHQEILSKLRNL